MIEKEDCEELLQTIGGGSWIELLQGVERQLRRIIDRVLQKKNIDGVQLPSDILKELTDAREEAFQWACYIRIFASEGFEGVQGSTINANHKGNAIRRDVMYRLIMYVEKFAAWEKESYQPCYNAFSTFDPMGTGFMEAQHLSHALFLLDFPWWEDNEGLVAELTSKLVDASSQSSLPSLFSKEDEARANAAKLFGVQTTRGLIRFSNFFQWYVNHTVNNKKDNNTPKMQSSISNSSPKSMIKHLNDAKLHERMVTLLEEEGIRAVLSVIARESREYTASCLRSSIQPLRYVHMTHAEAC